MRNKPPTEYAESVAFWQWFQLMYPDLVPVTFHVPNERTEAGQRKRLSRIGVRSGVSDYVILTPRGPFHGMCLEFKRAGASAKSVTQNQLDFLNAANDQGYFADFALGLDEAIKKVTHYLSLETHTQLD